jgi:PAS domain S-box-containing protein
MILAMFSAVTTAAVQESTNQVVDGMIRDANQASEMIPLLFNTGQELLRHFASAEQLRSPDFEIRQQALEADSRIGVFGPFFNQLILIDGESKPINHYPADSPAPELSPEEAELLQRTLIFGSPERSHVQAIEGEHMISFIAPVEFVNQALRWALVGRSQLSVNPTVGNLLSSLKGSQGSDSGFVVDERGFIAFHPDETYLLQSNPPDLACPEISGISEYVRAQAQGRACQDLALKDGTRRLVYYSPVEAVGNWTVVITYPYKVVLDRATRISAQVLLILLVLAGVLAVTVPWLTRRMTRPLQLLATAARSIAEGQLDTQVTLTGVDEVGQLGRAFERMRTSLKGRLEDFSLLLRVSQAVSSNLDVTQGIPTILAAALQATDARFVRLILLDERGDPQVVMAHGEGGVRVTALDRAMVRLGRGRRPARVENVAGARGLIESGLVGPRTRALIAVPMRSKDHQVGVMWLGYDAPHSFSDTEVDFLSTLASQAAVAVENARLFQAAEGGRRLAAILESTSDAVIVTDHADRVLLLNPAAAEAFGTDSKMAGGRPISEAVSDEKVIRLLTASMSDGVPLTDEVLLPDDRTLYASASIIVSGDGQTIGRVAVLRDITYLKELDEMKSEFVATVSHDLRAPLTFMRGYATMIPMVGDVSSKQQKYVDKIMLGIEQMTELIDDLLDLGRIEAGVGLMSEPCRLDDIIVTLVDSMRSQAQAKRLALRLDRTEDVTVVIGDASLLRRAISNLVDNAIKYTPQGGEVTVSWETRGNRVLISVTDTGIGIAKTDQARLFEKFSRIKRRETIDIKGSGLGLAIVKSVVERHCGRVWVESELGQGSTFHVELPIGEVENVQAVTRSR